MNWLFVAICHKQAVSDCQKIAIKKAKTMMFLLLFICYLYFVVYIHKDCLHSKRI